jgi:hypothetical protein
MAMQIGMGFGKFLARVLFQELGISVPSSVFHVLFITRSLHAKKNKKYALRSAACGGASRRCAAPIAAARALRATPPGRYAPSALRAHPFYNMKKKPI